MRLVRMLAFVVIFAAVLAAALGAAPADSAPSPVVLGQVGSASTTGFATAAGGCNCTVAQTHEGSGNSYLIPYDGVIVSSGTYVGSSVEATDTVQVQTVHRTGAATGTVVTEGLAHSLFGLAASTVDRFSDRLPAHAGDVLAARFHDSGYIEATPFFFKSSGATADEVRVSEPPAAAGGSLSAGSPVAERRVNLDAVLEPDEDDDGYGDASQDLCPGSPIATAACSGSLFGSDLQGEGSAKPSACLSSCTYVQTSLGGASTAASSPGVIVRWRVLNGAGGTYRISVLTDDPEGSGGAWHAYHVLGLSETATVTAPLNPVVSKISSFPTRLPIPAGAYVGIAVPGGGLPGFQSSAGQAKYSRTDSPFPGISGVGGESHNGAILYDADIEPDVDGDGYGDVSQDSCPSAASVHEGPCPVAASTGGGGAAVGSGQSSVPSSAAPRRLLPTIGSLAVTPRSFQVKPLGRAPAGGRWGTKVRLSLSAAATVTLAIEARHRHRFELVTHLTRKLNAGRASVAFDGRYRRAGKLVVLAPGTYRLSATARSGAGAGPVKRTAFTVLPPA